MYFLILKKNTLKTRTLSNSQTNFKINGMALNLCNFNVRLFKVSAKESKGWSSHTFYSMLVHFSNYNIISMKFSSPYFTRNLTNFSSNFPEENH